jgi:glycine hydroxymethyltransferase
MSAVDNLSSSLGEKLQTLHEGQMLDLEGDVEEMESIDPQASEILRGQMELRDSSLRCIASEAHTLPIVTLAQEAFGKAGRYGAYDEGEAGKKYYQGTEFASRAEDFAKGKVTTILEKVAPGNDFTVNVQPLSGANANDAVYAGLLAPGDHVMGINLAHGGHLSHFSEVSRTGEVYSPEKYHVTESGELDLDEIDEKMRNHQPRLIVVGGSALPKNIDYAAIKELCDKHGVLLMADISHTAGHQLTGKLKSKVFDLADVVTFTTHKMGGPKGAIILTRKGVMAKDYMSREKLESKFRKPDNARITAATRTGLFPGLQGGPNSINYLGIAALFSALDDQVMHGWSERVLQHVQDVQGRLLQSRMNLVAESDTHLILMDAERSSGSNGKSGAGKRLAESLERSGVIVNANGIRDDENGPFKPGGIRIGMNGPARRKGWDAETSNVFAGIVSRLTRELNDSEALAAAVTESRVTVDNIIDSHPIRWDF